MQDPTDLFQGLGLDGGEKTVVVVGLMMGLLRFLKFVLDRYVPSTAADGSLRRRPTAGEVEQEDRMRLTAAQVAELHSWHRSDGSGRQLWRSPDVLEGVRRLEVGQAEMRARLEEVYRISESTARRQRELDGRVVTREACDRHRSGRPGEKSPGGRRDDEPAA